MADHVQFSVVECGRDCSSVRKRYPNFRNFFKRKNDWKLIFIAVGYVSFVGLTLVHRAYKSSEVSAVLGSNPLLESHGRIKRDVTQFDDNFTLENGNNSSNNDNLGAEDENNTDCYPRSAEEFPGNFMSREETKDGGIFAHILIILYLFGAIAIVCDDYFCASLEIICDELKLKEDVAGATFMAAGSSAPEFFTAVIGVFIAKSDVGLGTIVGSAVFNILFIIGVCGLFAGMIVKLSWYPVLRDTLYYLLSVAVLVIVIQDGNVHWYEALIMFILYIFYIILMYFNDVISVHVTRIYEILTGNESLYNKDIYSQSLLGSQRSSRSRYDDPTESTEMVKSGEETKEQDKTNETQFSHSKSLRSGEHKECKRNNSY